MYSHDHSRLKGMTYNAENMWKFDDKESDSRHLQTRADAYTHSTSIYAEYDQPFDDFG